MRTNINGSPAQLKLPGSGPLFVPMMAQFANQQLPSALREFGEVNAPARQQNNPPTSNGQNVGADLGLPVPPMINAVPYTTQPPQIINSSP